MFAFVISVVVVGVAIGVVTVAVTSEMSKPATYPADSRRGRAARSQSRTESSEPASEPGPQRKSERSRLAPVAATGRVLGDTGRHVGQTLVELARSAVTVEPVSSNGDEPPVEVTADEDRSTVAEAGTSTTVETSSPQPVTTVPISPPPKSPPAAAPRPVDAAPRRARGQAVASWLHADVAATGLGLDPAPTVAPSPVRPRPLAGDAGPPVEEEPGRLYPAWWQRMMSFVGLVVIALALGLATGGAVAFCLVVLYRAIENAL